MPVRIQRRRTKGWRMPPGAVYVGRPSRWGNPWPTERVGPQLALAYDWSGISAKSPLWFMWAQRGLLTMTPVAAEVSVALYRRALEQCRKEMPDGLDEWLTPLRGRDLACWCPIDRPCHADVLLELANAEPQQ